MVGAYDSDFRRYPNTSRSSTKFTKRIMFILSRSAETCTFLDLSAYYLHGNRKIEFPGNSRKYNLIRAVGDSATPQHVVVWGTLLSYSYLDNCSQAGIGHNTLRFAEG